MTERVKSGDVCYIDPWASGLKARIFGTCKFLSNGAGGVTEAFIVWQVKDIEDGWVAQWLLRPARAHFNG